MNGTPIEQLDLFRDGRAVRLRNALRHALMNEDAEETEIAYRELKDFDASHRWLPHARTLIAALQTPAPADVNEGLAVLTRLEGEWTPAACAVLGEDGRAMLFRMWSDVGNALADAPFDPEFPDRHASHAYAKCEDWKSVERCVRGVPDYSAQPVLLHRIAEAICRQGRWSEAANHWFELCWSAPDAFRNSMDRGEIPDRVLCDGWHRARDQDIEPEITPGWFPAWMLIHKPKIAGLIPVPVANGSPQAAFAVLQELTIGDAEDAELRRQLQGLHPGLLKCFLSGR